MHYQKEDNKKIKNKKQPELLENQTLWKFNNQGVKEETFIQTGGRGGDRQPGRELAGKAAAGGPGWARQWLVEQVVPHLHADKPGGIAGEPDILSNPGFH